MYTTKKVKADKTLELDVLAHESGRCYSKIVSLMRKVKKKKGFWLSQGTVQNVGIERNLPTATITAITVALSIIEMVLVLSISGTKYRDSS